MSEFVGYRVNAKRPHVMPDGFVTVYAERRNETASLGEYGGDAYPIASAIESGDKTHEYGIILAADGVGQGAYTHPSLKNYLAELTVGVDKENEKYAKLSCFLRSLYGSELFDDKNSDALEYAARCFCDVPTDGFFVSPDENSWKSKENAQFVMPFFERDSQSLGSRILCVYIYLNFRNYMKENNITEWTEEKAAALRDKINNGIRNEFAQKVDKLFSNDDADNTSRKMRYFLCSTVAVWFYALDKSSGHVSALSLNCGDARTYLVTGTDGVRQISVDDAVADGSMTGFFHFGSTPKNDGGFCDNTLFARIAEADAPCALFACSDGVYDTCPAKTESDGKKYSLPYGDTEDANDFLFEKNMIEALRRSYSFEDFKREVVFNFYAQSKAQDVLESCDGGRYKLIKRDDSATLAARFIGKHAGPLEITDVLRANKNTSVDKLWNMLESFEVNNIKIPYFMPHVERAEDARSEKKEAYATGEFKDALSETVKSEYPKLYKSMRENDAQTIWGVTHLSPTELTGFALNQKFVKVMANYETFLDLAIADWTYLDKNKFISNTKNGCFCKLPNDWKAHEHLIYNSDIFNILKGMDFGSKVKEFTSDEVAEDKTADIMLKLYDWFSERFSGKTDKSRDEVWTAFDSVRIPVDGDPADIILNVFGDNAAAPQNASVSSQAHDAHVVVNPKVGESSVKPVNTKREPEISKPKSGGATHYND